LVLLRITSKDFLTSSGFSIFSLDNKPLLTACSIKIEASGDLILFTALFN